MSKIDKKHFCPLLQKEIFYGGADGCYEINDVREGELDPEFVSENIDVEKANIICEECGWYKDVNAE